ncbi:MAG: hydroxymethylbilane synthase, partial [Nevskiales bacterium]|nr:hydroxymethylbilane synthase [Nevskiales bacterium]
MTAVLRIATRQSALALWQAGHVKTRLESVYPDLGVELVPLITTGDRWLERPLAGAGGKGLFVKELEEALLEGRADLAAHSMKDVPVAGPGGLCFTAFLPAEDPRDAFVSGCAGTLRELPSGACVGTSSLRRQAQLRAERPDLQMLDLRGNVGTRLTRLDEGRCDAVLLACAGLRRLGLSARIREALDVERFVPAIGQGIIGIECRENDEVTRRRLTPLNDPLSATRLTAERALNARLGGACTVPVAGHAVIGEAGVRVLVTRPAHQSENLCRLIEAEGGTAICLP